MIIVHNAIACNYCITCSRACVTQDFGIKTAVSMQKKKKLSMVIKKMVEKNVQEK